MTRTELHSLLDRIPETELPRVELFLGALIDPVLRALEEAEWDDEPVTPEDLRALEEARQDVKAGRLISFADVKAKFKDELTD